jgi:hypothetical protein
VTRNNKQCYDYNFPLYFDAEYDIPELYQSFHFINNPRADVKRDYYLVNGFEYAPDDFCAEVKKIHENFFDLYVMTEKGRAIPEEIEVNFQTETVTLQNLRISC